MRYLQRNNLIPSISMNVTPFLHNLPTMLTIDGNHLGIAAEHNEDRLRATYEHGTGIISMSTVIKKSNFELEATVECTPKRGVMVASETPIATEPRSYFLHPSRQYVLWNQNFVQQQLLEAYD